MLWLCLVVIFIENSILNLKHGKLLIADFVGAAAAAVAVVVAAMIIFYFFYVLLYNTYKINKYAKPNMFIINGALSIFSGLRKCEIPQLIITILHRCSSDDIRSWVTKTIQ